MNAGTARRSLIVAASLAVVAWSGVAALGRSRAGAAGAAVEESPTSDWRERAAGPGIVPFPQVGSVARDFTLPLLHPNRPWVRSDSLTLSDLRGRWVYLDVFGTWCGPCQAKYPVMDEVAEEVESAGGTVIGLLLNDRPEAAAAWFASQGGMSYPFLVLDEETTRRWQIRGAPMGFLVSPDGHIARRCFGCAEEGDRIEKLAATIAGMPD
jgi:thiol-disulfide isomerase/thioredoxin